jgi:hypothetical protein
MFRRGHGPQRRMPGSGRPEHSRNARSAEAWPGLAIHGRCGPTDRVIEAHRMRAKVRLDTGVAPLAYSGCSQATPAR